MPSNTRGSILLSTAENVGTILKKKLSSPTGFSPSEWADAINLLGALPVKTASGSIAHFEDGADTVPLKSAKFYITPTQASGTPTPSNPLPISGHTGLTITRTGANLFDSSILEEEAAWQYYDLYLPVGTYTMSTTKPDSNDNNLLLYFRVSNDSTLSSTTKVYDTHPVTRTITEGQHLQVVYRRSSGTDLFSNYTYMIELGSTATAYEAYTTPHVYPVSWSEHGTVYGGYFKDGELWGTQVSKTYTGAAGESWFKTSIGGKTAFGILLPDDADKTTTGSRLPVLCNIGLYISSGNNDYGCYQLNTDSTHAYFYYIPVNISEVADFKTWLENNNLQVKYNITPVKVADLEEVEITSLLGVNNIWTDAGDSEVEYRADIDLLITSLGG